MDVTLYKSPVSKYTHSWLRTIHVAFVPGKMTPLLEEVAHQLFDYFRSLGHVVQDVPNERTDLILTTALVGQSVNWRESVMLTGRRRLNLNHSPTVVTMMHITPARLQELLDYFEVSLAKEPPDPADFAFPGLAPEAHRTLIEQGRRGGPLLAVERLLQAQAKSIRILLVVGEDRPLWAHHFDLVGAFPRSDGRDPAEFYTDIVLRMVTSISTSEITDHRVVGEPIPRAVWDSLTTPTAMAAASHQLDQRNFFTEMVQIADLVEVPAAGDAVASQYSEGCYGTWDAELGGLVATITGSARPVDKGNLTEDDLVVIVGVRPDGRGAQIRHVLGKLNSPPSSEAVEMMDMDGPLPRITLPLNGRNVEVPVIRSKLHGHRGVGAYDPSRVEYVPLAPPYYHYPVSCATEAQAQGIKAAFSRSETLRNPDDPRLVAFTVLPGHGCMLVEKWVPDKAPFQVLWEYMDAGYVRVENRIPQGLMEYVAGPDGQCVLQTEE